MNFRKHSNRKLVGALGAVIAVTIILVVALIFALVSSSEDKESLDVDDTVVSQLEIEGDDVVEGESSDMTEEPDDVMDNLEDTTDESGDNADESSETTDDPDDSAEELGDTTDELDGEAEEPEESTGSDSSSSSQSTDGINVVSNPDDITVCINKQNYLPDGWSPSDLVNVSGNFYLRSEAATAYKSMIAQASSEGVSIILLSAYRTQEYQTTLYSNYYAKDPENAPFYSAYPRSSEHELGLAIDVSYDYSLHSDLDETQVGIWMFENAYKYGWILSYPEDKTELTGYMYEPWHWRYVGVDLATYLWENDLTLQEYYY